MEEKLKPTLWRTARALANADRLNLMRLVFIGKGTKNVSELASESGLPIPTVSIYLRALNARGLISVMRSGPYVYYGTSSDRSLPVAIEMQKSFHNLFGLKELPPDWTDRLLPVLNVYCSPRREGMVRVLSEYPNISYSEFCRRSGICVTSFLRHLGILVQAGVVQRGKDGLYSLSKARNSLEAVFLAACGQRSTTTAFI